MEIKLLGITNVDFGVIDQLLIKFSVSVRFCRKNGSIMARYISYLLISRKPRIQLRGKNYTKISSSLEYQETSWANSNVFK
jgi:hypothetical protein